MIFFGHVAGILLAAATTQATQPASPPLRPPPVTTPDAAVAARAMALAQTTNSDAIIVGDEKSDAKAIKMATDVFGANKDFQALEVKYPGISLELARGMMPVINRSARERLPVLWQRQADFYSKHFSASELDTLNAFYQSSTGQKLIRSMIANIDPKAMIAEAKQSSDFKFGADSALTDIKATVPAALKQMDDADKAVLEKLGRSGLMTKMQAIAPETQAIAIAWMNESAPWEDAELDKVIQAVLQRRVKEKSK
jgi:hypothetical protein